MHGMHVRSFCINFILLSFSIFPYNISRLFYSNIEIWLIILILDFYNVCQNISRPPDAYNDVLRNLVDHDKAHEGIYVS